ncbi:MAG: hypothetical protein JXB60_06950 [Candidatus Cloacimonetes bacterium]|nr:hypothetical protein [Candidatus Cloacimonadota bacterium]
MKTGFAFMLAAALASTIILSAQIMGDNDIVNAGGPGFYRILNDNIYTVKIPFHFHDGKPLMELEINGSPATLMIDNGVLWDQVWLFGSPLVDELKLRPVEESMIGGVGEGDPTQAYTSSNLTLRFPDIIFYEQPVLVSPPAAGFAAMFPGADGQLCNTFFKHFIVEFNFINNTVVLHNPDLYQYQGNGSRLPMVANASGTYCIPFGITMPDGRTYDDRVDIDLGGIYPLKIALNNRHNIQLPSGVQETLSYGVQGRASEYRGKIKSMTIGDYEFADPTVIFGDERTSRIHPDNLGVIGLPLFRKFNVIFDYFNNALYIEPNGDLDTPFE